MTFEDLATLHGSPEQIPDDVLYRYVIRPDVFDTLRGLLLTWKEADAETKKALEQAKMTPWLRGVGREVCRRAKADLFFLARYFLWNTNPACLGKDISFNLISDTHRPVCNLFIKKDCNKAIAQQDWKKERLLLWPRGGMKSTIDVCDAVQWILNFPDIRICFLTAEDGLAVGLTQQTKGHFLNHAEDNLSWMNLFFPQYCVDGSKRESEYVFNCPLWTAKGIGRTEATVMAFSIGSNLSGHHFEVIKADDVVSNKNATTEEYCEKITREVRLNRKTLLPYGYIDYIGTRYADEDMYGEIIEKNVGDIVATKTPNLELINNKTTGQQVAIGRAWEIRPEIQKLLDDGSKQWESLQEQDYTFLLPAYHTYTYLKKEQTDDETIFEGQFNQNPRPRGKTIFEQPLLTKRTVDFQKIPVSGPISITWDFAFASTKKDRDFCTASVMIWNDKAQGFVIDLVRARFNPAQLAKAVVDLAIQYKPFVVGIEKAGGSQLLMPSILAEAAKPGVPADVQATINRIEWIDVDLQKDAKRIRMAALHPMLMNEQLFFVSHLPFLQVLYDEFKRCLVSKSAHNDIPDVISFQPRYMPRMMMAIAKNESWTFSRSDSAYNILFEGADAFGRTNTGYVPTPINEIIIDEQPRPEPPPGGFDPILGVLAG